MVTKDVVSALDNLSANNGLLADRYKVLGYLERTLSDSGVTQMVEDASQEPTVRLIFHWTAGTAALLRLCR